MSLSQQTIRIRHQLREQSKSGRKHWDLFRHMYNVHVLMDALHLVIKNRGAAGVDGQTIKSIRGREWKFVGEIQQELKAKNYRPRPIYEMKFHDFSYGFRPKRKAVEAVAEVASEVLRSQ